jgi:hypothetical protein
MPVSRGITRATETANGVQRRSLLRSVMLFHGRHVDVVAFTTASKMRP